MMTLLQQTFLKIQHKGFVRNQLSKEMKIRLEEAEINLENFLQYKPCCK